MYQLIRQGKDYNVPVKLFICDTIAELSTLSSLERTGTLVYVINEKKKYILNFDKNWEEYASSGGSIPVEEIERIVNDYLDSHPEIIERIVEEMIEPIPASTITQILV